MQIIFLLIPLLTATGAVAWCGTPSPTLEHKATARQLHSRELQRRNSMPASITPIYIDIYYHVIASNTSIEGGYIDESFLFRQTKALNERYGPHSIFWNHAGVERIVNPEWSSNQNEVDMKRQLRKGGYADLNVYTFQNIAYSHNKVIPITLNLLGETFGFPKRTEAGDVHWLMDSINVRYDTITGVAPPHELGMSLVHETGHWLGLYHTFQGGCDDEYGDGIDDTPAENRTNPDAPFTCDIGRVSCPGEGLDAVTNYMNYSPEFCVKEFTKGQEIRMHSLWNAFRAPHHPYPFQLK